MEVDCGNLEALPLSLIFEKLVERIDHIYFSVVCKNWYSIAKFNYQNRQVKNNVLPMLMIPTKRRCKTKRGLYGISFDKIYNFQLSVPHNKRLCGSSHGWLAKMDITISSRLATITLLNPFNNIASIILPTIYMKNMLAKNMLGGGRSVPERNVHKVILSSNPTTNPRDYVVVAIYGGRACLAFMKAGENCWTHIDPYHHCFTDVIFYRGLVYAVGGWNHIVSFDICNSRDSFDPEKINVVSPLAFDTDYAHRAYLVESLEGDLWLVRKFIGYGDDDIDEDINPPSCGTERFEVYKLELDLKSGKLIHMLRLDSLGDNVLFLGDSDSISMSASYFANYLQKDSIYYTDDFYEEDPISYPNGPFDMKIFNVKDGGFSQHCRYQHWFTRMPPSLWVIPPFRWD
ncbi:hypothetical protein MtrunA17_Chr1g0181301 [Medicago truncatula]|uniref:Ubiquitin-protein ligase n=1 Tax=Medicago truncatula TaxID=3880 RepID=A0A072VKT8_MEDTR|nr:uncharacterized protein LOC25484009 [Medicago truncatula]KEH42241.1 ubiquitin-protein ligase [Medicago truncatula]RHN79802.1 hypothetical protein MtrunA17_Chr1g0181301 [Medicago truncatula]